MTIYIFISDLPEHEGLLEEFGRFTDARPSRPPLAQVQIVLISFDGAAIAGCGRMSHHRRKAANYKWHITIDEFEPLDDPLSFSDLAGALGESAAEALRAAARTPGGQLREALAEEVLSALTRLRPDAASALDHLRHVSTPQEPRARSAGEPIVEYERDAVGLALEFAGLTRERISALSAWDGRSDEPFIEGIAQYTVIEDRAIEHDARVFGDWPLIKRSMAGATRFESRGRRVTIINVNRAGIERAIGVDLIYYTQRYDSYVVVQYKRRERGGTDEKWSFRPNARFDDELDRMRDITVSANPQEAPHEFRLDERCCYLKICAATTPDAFSSDLVNGAYIPLDYWDLLESSGLLKGPRGGRVLTDQTVGRYLSNTDFIRLVRASWIGSRAETSETIGRIVAAGLELNKSLMLAHAQATDEDGSARDSENPSLRTSAG